MLASALYVTIAFGYVPSSMAPSMCSPTIYGLGLEDLILTPKSEFASIGDPEPLDEPETSFHTKIIVLRQRSASGRNAQLRCNNTFGNRLLISRARSSELDPENETVG